MRKKRLSSLFLAVVMAVSLCPVLPSTAFAAGGQSDSTGAWIGSITYNGREQKLKPQVSDATTGQMLTENVDYTLSYSNNVHAGTAYVTVQGIGSHSNSLGYTATFTIEPARLTVTVNDADCPYYSTPSYSYTITSGQLYGSDTLPAPTYSLAQKQGQTGVYTINAVFPNVSDYDIEVIPGTLTYTDTDFNVDNVSAVTYNGAAQTPKPLVTSKSGAVLTENTHYRLSYQNNRDAGTGTIIITGLGTYANQVKQVQFTINPAPIKIRVNDVLCKVNETPIFSYTMTSGQLYGGDQLSTPTYSLYSGTNGTKGITVSFTQMSNYDIQVTDGTLTYTSGSSTGTVVVGDIGDVYYNGSVQTPKPTVTTASGTTLTEGSHYTLNYSNNRYAGQASVRVTGIGSYSGVIDKTVYFNILRAPLTVQVNDVRCSIYSNPAYSYVITKGRLYGTDSLGTPTYSTYSKTGYSYGPTFGIRATFSSSSAANYDITVLEGTLTYTDVDASGLSYAITASSNSGGTISPSGRTMVYRGESQTYRFYPNSGYEIVAVYVDGYDVGDVDRYTFSNVRADHEIYVDFGRTDSSRYEIEVDCSSGGTVSPSGSVYVSRGNSRTFYFSPNSGYEVEAIYVDGRELSYVDDDYTFSNVRADHTLYVEFVRTGSTSTRYEIDASSSSGGSISPSGTVRVTRGNSRTFSFEPNSGYEVSAIYVDGKKLSYVDDDYTFSNVRDDHTIYVEFARTSSISSKYTIKATSSSGGSISPSGTASVTRGSSKTYKFTANSGYRIYAVYVDGEELEGIPSSYTFSNVRDDHTIYVEFEKGSNTTKYEIEASASSGGTISPSGTATVTRGNSKTYNFTAKSGYRIAAVYVDDVKISGVPTSYTFSGVRDDHTIYVEFEKGSNSTKYDITATASSGGRVSPSGTASVTRGNSKTYTFTPSSGYEVLGVYVDGEYVGYEDEYTFSAVDDDHVLYVEFAKASGSTSRYDIDITCTGNGTVSPNNRGTITVARGNDRTFTFTPDEGYEVYRVYVDGKQVTTADSYTFKSVSADHTLTVEFAKTGSKLSYPTYWVNPFVDVKAGDWFYESVKYMNGNGLVQGTSATTFSPNVNTTRGMIITILYRLAGSPAVSSGTVFYDVGANAYCADAVKWGVQNNIISGYGDGTFRPEDPITREEMVTALYNYSRYEGYSVSNLSDLTWRYTDYGQISSFAITPMSWAHANGIITGRTTTTINPKDTTTRAEVSTIFTRFCLRFSV